MKLNTGAADSISIPMRGVAPAVRHWSARQLLLAAAVLIAASVSVSAQSPVDIFMKIGGQAAAMGSTQGMPALQGESTDVQYPKWTQIMSISHGVSLPVTIGSGGTSIGKASLTDVHVSNQMDKTAPAINLLACGSATGLSVSLPIDYVTIDFRTTGSSPVVFYRVELQGVYITSATVGSSSDTPVQSISLTYQRIKWTYVPYSSGKAGTAVTTGWDVVKNLPL